MPKLRKPKKEGDYYVWQESFADAIDHDYVINSLVYQRMNKYVKCDGSKLFKYYNSNTEALQDYFKASQSLLKDVLKGKRDRGYYMVYANIMEDMLYTLEN